MTEGSQRVLTGPEPPYEAALELMGLLLPILASARHGGAAYVVWGALTDLVDGPDSGMTRDEAEATIRAAAAEGLSIAGSDEAVTKYLERWSNPKRA